MEQVLSELKQSVSEWCYFRKEYDPAVYYKKLREMGYLGVEMVDPSRWAAAKAAGLKLVNISGPGMQKGLNRLENHGELIPKIRECITAAAANEISQVIIFSGNRGGQADEVGLKNCIEAGRQLVW